jgi:hypothetical protein
MSTGNNNTGRNTPNTPGSALQGVNSTGIGNRSKTPATVRDLRRIRSCRNAWKSQYPNVKTTPEIHKASNRGVHISEEETTGRSLKGESWVSPGWAGANACASLLSFADGGSAAGRGR